MDLLEVSQFLMIWLTYLCIIMVNKNLLGEKEILANLVAVLSSWIKVKGSFYLAPKEGGSPSVEDSKEQRTGLISLCDPEERKVLNGGPRN